MDIKHTLTTTMLEKSTVEADYIIEHMSENGVMRRINMTIKEKNSDNVIGTIYQENDSIGGNFSLIANVSQCFADYNIILEEVITKIQSQKETTTKQ